jgi:DNA-binding transcriptional ArsR family regulator
VSLAGLDPVIHAPKRLTAMAILAASEWAEFAFLRDRLDVSDSDLSKQMRTLVEAGYVKATKRGTGRGGSTWYRITRAGREAFDTHVAALRALVEYAPDPAQVSLSSLATPAEAGSTRRRDGPSDAPLR